MCKKGPGHGKIETHVYLQDDTVGIWDGSDYQESIGERGVSVETLEKLHAETETVQSEDTMSKIVYFMLLVIAMFFIAPIATAQTDDEKGAYKTQVPTGMELQQVGSGPGYRVVLPKGTAIRREGDLKIVEGTGEYAARKFVEYDALLNKMSAQIESLQRDVEEIKDTISEMQKAKLLSN